MDFKQGMDFEQVDGRYADLERRRGAGEIDEKEFEEQRKRMMVLDDEGRWWSKSPEGGEWHYHDGSAWVRGTPPVYRDATPEPMDGRTQAPGPGAGRRKRQVWPWVAAAVIVLVGLVGIGLLVWSLLPPDLFGEGEAGGQGEAAPTEEESGGTAIDAAFVHRATPENISANSTYLDNALINENPDAVLYVTQNWNPGGEGGTYNDHAVGVWYDPDRQRWAVFNQDREPMTEEAAFNVAVLAEPAG